MARLAFPPFLKITKDNGAVCTNATADWYAAGGGFTRLDTWPDSTLTGTPNANPVVADANGVFPQMWLQDNVEYKVVISGTGFTTKTVDEVYSVQDLSLVNDRRYLGIAGGAAWATGGSSNAYTVTTGLELSVYTTQALVLVIPNFTNTGAATINFDGLGVVAIRKKDGATALIAGDMTAGQPVLLSYSGTYWQLLGGVTNADLVAQLAAYQPLDADLTSVAAAGVAAFSGLLFGLKLSNSTGDATNDTQLDPGIAIDSTQTEFMQLASAIIKQLDAAWAVGSNAGGLDQGSIANGTYHKHLIKRVDTGVVDAIYSLSHDKSATVTMTVASPAVVTWGVAGAGHGLVAGAPFKFSTTGALPTGVTAGTQYFVIATGLTETTFQFAATNGGAAINSSGTQSGVHTGLPGPLLPANYTKFRRIGSILRESAAIVPFVQVGDKFVRSVPVMDINATAPGTAAVTRTISVPTGIPVEAIVSFYAINSVGANSAVLVTALSQADTAPTTSGALSFLHGAGANAAVSGELRVITNASAQFRSRHSASDANEGIRLVTTGWIDTRGRGAA